MNFIVPILHYVCTCQWATMLFMPKVHFCLLFDLLIVDCFQIYFQYWAWPGVIDTREIIECFNMNLSNLPTLCSIISVIVGNVNANARGHCPISPWCPPQGFNVEPKSCNFNRKMGLMKTHKTGSRYVSLLS